MVEAGDVVKVLKKAANYEHNWHNAWNAEMDKGIGAEGIVVCKGLGGVTIKFDPDPHKISTFRWPEHVLEVVKQRVIHTTKILDDNLELLEQYKNGISSEMIISLMTTREINASSGKADEKIVDSLKDLWAKALAEGREIKPAPKEVPIPIPPVQTIAVADTGIGSGTAPAPVRVKRPSPAAAFWASPEGKARREQMKHDMAEHGKLLKRKT